jgi:hypothetical protein
VAIAPSPLHRDTDGDGSNDGVECALAKNPADATSKPSVSLPPAQVAYFRIGSLTLPGGSLLALIDDSAESSTHCADAIDDDGDATVNDGCPPVGTAETFRSCLDAIDSDGDSVVNDGCMVAGSLAAGVPETRRSGIYGGAWADTDRDGCADEVEAIDVDGNRIVNDSDRLALSRAALGVGTFAPLGSLTPEEIRTADVDGNGLVNDVERLASGRLALTASIATIPNFNLGCTATRIGYNPS